jgi:hypothetical protein
METAYKHLEVFLVLMPIVFALQLFTYKNVHNKSNKVLGFLMIVFSVYYFINRYVPYDIVIFNYLSSTLIFPILLSFHPFYYLYGRIQVTNATF